MIDREKIASVAIALFSLILLVVVIPRDTPPYQGYGVSPALIPNLAAGLMLLLSLIRLSGRTGERGATGDAGAENSGNIPAPGKKAGRPARDGGSDRASPTRTAAHLAKFFPPCFLLLPLMARIGFIPAGLVFMLVMQYLCGQRNPLTMLLVGVLTVGGLYLAMVYGFKVPMP